MTDSAQESRNRTALGKMCIFECRRGRGDSELPAVRTASSEFCDFEPHLLCPTQFGGPCDLLARAVASLRPTYVKLLRLAAMMFTTRAVQEAAGSRRLLTGHGCLATCRVRPSVRLHRRPSSQASSSPATPGRLPRSRGDSRTGHRSIFDPSLLAAS